MPTPLLIITADIPFGELIRRSLEETERFVVGVAREQEAAKIYAHEFKPALAFLDTSLTENELLKIGAILRQANPGIIFVVISEAGWHSALEELFPREYLSKPFYLPELMEIIDKYIPASAAGDGSTQEESESKNELPWLSDVTRAAQHLTRLTLESSAQAALITRSDKLWAYAGQLPQPAARELAETLSRYWDHEEENDLVRFVRLVSTNAEHMLYATRLAEGMVLALVFDAETPFSTIRTQASQLVHSLSTSPTDEQQDEDLSESGLDTNRLSDILSDIPAPNPLTNLPIGSGYDFKTSVPATRKGSTPAIQVPSASSTDLPREYSFQAQVKPLVSTDESRIASAPVESSPQGITRNYNQRNVPAPESLEETRPNSFAGGAHRIVLEPVSPAVYNLDYACVLLPRFPQHHITGDLMDRLGEWVPQICIAYNWRLEYISVRPDYLQWIVNVPPVTAPANLMRILRHHTSEKIFVDFPRFRKENPSGEFWAPGYLIMGGSQPPPAQLIKDFITQTRQNQGILPQSIQ